MKRSKEIVAQYLIEIEKHMRDLKSGAAATTFQIKDLAALLHIHPVHLSNTIQEELGRSPCDIYEERLIGIAKELITGTDLSIAAIARQLTFDPSNFSKFFRHFEGMTPTQFRDKHRERNSVGT